MTKLCLNVLRALVLAMGLLGVSFNLWAEQNPQAKRKSELTAFIKKNMPWRFSGGSADGFFQFPPTRDVQQGIEALRHYAKDSDIAILADMLNDIAPADIEKNRMAYVIYHALFKMGREGLLAVFATTYRAENSGLRYPGVWLRSMSASAHDFVALTEDDIQTLKNYFLRTKSWVFYNPLQFAKSALQQGLNGSYLLCFDGVKDETTFYACRHTLFLARNNRDHICEIIQAHKNDCVHKMESRVEQRLSLALGTAKTIRGDAVSSW